MPPDLPDISEEILLGRTLLEQGHLSTAQRVLVKVCQQHPDNAEAFRGLGEVLRRKGDAPRARVIGDYAQDLNAAAAPGPKTPLPEARPTAPVPPPVAPATSAPGLTMPSPGQVARPAPTEQKGAAAPAAAGPGPKKSGKGKYLVAALMLLAGLGFVGYRVYKPSQRRGSSPREELDAALASGSFERLARARDRARAVLSGASPDSDALLRLALADAFLSLDHGVSGTKGAEETLRRLPLDGLNPEQLALAETVRGLLALATGDRAAAKQQVDAALARSVAKPLPVVLVAAARVRVLAGDATAAGQYLDLALQLAPEFAPAVADWVALRIDAGDATAARRVAREFLAKNKAASRVRLLAADAERALGQIGWTKHVEIGCRDESRISRALRAACWVASAWHARLDGERATAVRKARAAGQVSEDPRVLADSALLLASLGEIDAADETLQHARKLADVKFVPLGWADLAIRLGRGQQVDGAGPLSPPSLPERHLVVLRALYLRGGGAAMAAAVKNVPAGLSELDSDLRTYLELGGEVSRSDRAALDRRAERGNPVAAFVLGVMAAREDDHKQAAKRLEKALVGHGDACRAALLYLSAVQAQGGPSQPNRALLHALHARNAQCPIPEM